MDKRISLPVFLLSVALFLPTVQGCSSGSVVNPESSGADSSPIEIESTSEQDEMSINTEEANDEAASEFEVSWETNPPSSFGDSDSFAQFKDTRIVNSPEYGYLLVMDFSYTNSSSEAKNFINDMSCSVDVFQGGVQLDYAQMTSEDGVYDYDDAFTQIKNGGVIETQLVWDLRDTESPLEVDFGMDENFQPVYVCPLTISPNQGA